MEKPGSAPPAAPSQVASWEDALRSRSTLDHLLKTYAPQQRRCEEIVKRALSSSPMITHLTKAMKDRGCALAEQSVRCLPVPDGKMMAAFHPASKTVLYNSIYATDQRRVTETLLHELIHAYDSCRVYLDFKSCRHLACTEIRAANLSNDCGFRNELSRVLGGEDTINFGGQQKRCVKRRALQSIQDHPACAGQDPKRVIGTVFRRCYADTAPFPTTPV